MQHRQPPNVIVAQRCIAGQGPMIKCLWTGDAVGSDKTTGQSSTLISTQMEISARTLKMHRTGIMHRLGFGHVADLILFYERSQNLLDNWSKTH